MIDFNTFTLYKYMNLHNYDNFFYINIKQYINYK